VDKRQHKRFIKRCEVEFIVNDIAYRRISSDFSLSGFFIRTNRPPAPGTILHIVIHLPDGSTSKVTGKVMWASKTSVGRLMGTIIKTLKNGMGIKIIEKDTNYLHFIKSLHDFSQ
jgi:hypothetical protein